MIYKIGHAGAAGHAPPNTISSIKKALELEVDMIEFDVHRCKSGEVVVIHDKTVNRTTNGRGKVKDMTLNQLKQLEVVEADLYQQGDIEPETIPTLEEVLDVIDRRAEVNIEIKSLDAAVPVADIVRRYIGEKEWDIEDFLISSFNTKALEMIRATHPRIRIGVLTSFPNRKTLSVAKKLRAYSINPDFPYLESSFVSLAHRQNFKIFPFTVNEPEDIEALKLIGVDGMFSDFPERV